MRNVERRFIWEEENHLKQFFRATSNSPYYSSQQPGLVWNEVHAKDAESMETVMLGRVPN